RFVPSCRTSAATFWGDAATVQARFEGGVSDLSLERRFFTFDYPFPPADVVEIFELFYGPMNRIFARLEEDARQRLRTELVALWSEHNRAAGSGLTIVSAEYLHVVATRA